MAASTEVRRRTVLSGSAAAAAFVGLAGCGLTGRAGAEDDTDADTALVEAALAEEVAFGEMCDLLRAKHRNLAGRLRAVAATQTVHADALRATLPDPPPTMPTTDGTRASVSVRDVSREANRLYAKRLADCNAATAGRMAQLFGSMAASHAVTAQFWRTR